MDRIRDELAVTGEFKNHLRALILLQVVSLFLMALLGWHFFSDLSAQNSNRLYAAAALIEEQYPRSFREVVPILTGKEDRGQITAGKKIMEVYGGVASLSPSRLIFGGLVFWLFMSMLHLLIFHKYEKRLFRRIASLSQVVLSVLKGEKVYGSVNHSEGIFDLFVSRFNRMVDMLQKSAEKLGEEKEFLKDIITHISHQLKTPMASLIMYSDLMLGDPAMEESQRLDFLSAGRTQLERMEWLVKSLLKLARLETGSIRFEKRKCNPAELIDEVVDRLKPLIGSRKIELKNQGEAVCSLNIDGEWTAEALENIVKNALEHTDPRDGSVRILLERSPLFFRFYIRDNGPGIDEKDLPRIFERFYKGGHSVNMESVGIGLSLSKMIVEAQGGDIRARLPEEGGTEFILTFPY